MVIRALAIELYRAQQTVHKLQDELETAPLAERDRLRRELRSAQAERDQLRRLIEARKEPPPHRRKF
jgi:hypothetical protein